MSTHLSAQVHADLSSLVYDPSKELAQKLADEDAVVVGGETFLVKAFVDTPRTGYQGAIFEHVGSGALVVAHRGTEFDREPVQDGLNNLSMVVSRTNVQAPEAIALTRQALLIAAEVAADKGIDLPVSVTGHSAGGTLGQITAHHFDLPGHTFNAYGAVSLDGCLPRGGERVFNHVMAGDLVAAASPHYGQVITYARPEHIEAMQAATREARRGWFGGSDGRPPVDLQTHALDSVRRSGFDPHYVSHFASEDGQGRAQVSVLADPQARALAQQNQALVEGFNRSAGSWRLGAGVALAAPAHLVGKSTGLGSALGCWIRGEVPPGEPGRREGLLPPVQPASAGPGAGSSERADDTRLPAPLSALSGHSQELVHQSAHWLQSSPLGQTAGWGLAMDKTALAMAAAAREAGLAQISLFDVREGQIHIGHHDGVRFRGASLVAESAARTPLQHSYQSLAQADASQTHSHPDPASHDLATPVWSAPAPQHGHGLRH